MSAPDALDASCRSQLPSCSTADCSADSGQKTYVPRMVKPKGAAHDQVRVRSGWVRAGLSWAELGWAVRSKRAEVCNGVAANCWVNPQTVMRQIHIAAAVLIAWMKVTLLNP